MIKVEDATENDCGVYAKILSKELGYNYQEAVLHLKNKEILKIEDDGVNLGFISFLRQKDSIYITDLDIIQEYRGKGYGSLLLAGLEKKARELHLKMIWLHVGVDNRTAIEFYLKNGFRKKERIKGFYNSKFDAYVFVKELTD